MLPNRSDKSRPPSLKIVDRILRSSERIDHEIKDARFTERLPLLTRSPVLQTERIPELFYLRDSAVQSIRGCGVRSRITLISENGLIADDDFPASVGELVDVKNRGGIDHRGCNCDSCQPGTERLELALRKGSVSLDGIYSCEGREDSNFGMHDGLGGDVVRMKDQSAGIKTRKSDSSAEATKDR